MLKQYETYSDFLGDAQKYAGRGSGDSGGSWYGYLSYTESLSYAVSGDESLVDKCNRVSEQIDIALPATPCFSVQRNPAVGRCNMGDWFAGSPTPMRARRRSQSDSAPIRVYVGVVSSGSLDTEQMANRGAAILALLLQLQKSRPVELYAFAEIHGATDGWLYQVIPIESRPINLSVAAFVLIHAAFTRHLIYTVGSWLDGFNGKWPTDHWYYPRNNKQVYEKNRRQRLGLNPQDVIIDSFVSGDEASYDPIAWVKKQLIQINREGDL